MHLTGPQFLIRPIDPTSPSDLAAVLEVYRQCEDFLALGPVATASMEMVRADLKLSADAGGDFCGIFDPQTGVMMGIVDTVICGFEGHADAAGLELMMIGAPHRHKGLGEAVFHAVEDAVRRDGRAKVFRSGVQVNNPNAIRFWQRMGFQIVSGPEQMPDSTICYQLWKSL